MDPQRARSEQSDSLHEALDSGTTTQLRGLVQDLHPAETADFLEALPPTQRKIVWELIDAEDGGEVLVALNEEVRATLIQVMQLPV